jgi:hypothetical protein
MSPRAITADADVETLRVSAVASDVAPVRALVGVPASVGKGRGGCAGALDRGVGAPVMMSTYTRRLFPNDLKGNFERFFVGAGVGAGTIGNGEVGAITCCCPSRKEVELKLLFLSSLGVEGTTLGLELGCESLARRAVDMARICRFGASSGLAVKQLRGC